MLIVGEKLNSSIKRVAEAIEQRDAATIQDLAKRQAEAGAHYIDVNAAIRVSAELDDLSWLVETAQSVIDTPLCVDSPNPAALARGLALVKAAGKPGRPMVNSITGEPDRMHGILPLVAEHRCPVVALTSDERGIPTTVGERLRIAGRIVDEALKFGVPLSDLYFDPLVLPVSVDCNNGMVFMDALRAIKAEYPEVRTISGLSNISYGVPKRKVVNRAFLIAARCAGMDAAIMDPLDVDLMALLKAAELVLGNDEFCMNYLMAFRAGQLGAGNVVLSLARRDAPWADERTTGQCGLGATSERFTRARPELGRVRPMSARSELDAPLSLDAFVKGMLDLVHLGDQVSGFHQWNRSVAPGDDQVQVRGAVLLQPGQNLCRIEPAIAQGIGEFVQQDQVIAPAGDFLLCQGPGRSRPGDRLGEIGGPPGPAIAQRVPLDADLLRGPDLSPAALVALDELDDADAQSLPPGAKHRPQGSRGLALAMAGVDDEQPSGLLVLRSIADVDAHFPLRCLCVGPPGKGGHGRAAWGTKRRPAEGGPPTKRPPIGRPARNASHAWPLFPRRKLTSSGEGGLSGSAVRHYRCGTAPDSHRSSPIVRRASGRPAHPHRSWLLRRYYRQASRNVK